VSGHEPVTWTARLGLTARAVVYLVLSALAFELALGRTHKETDQRGAFETVAKQVGGHLLLGLLAAGLIAYALWRLSEAAFGVAGSGNKAGPRLKSFFRGLVYAVLAYSAIEVLVGSGQTNQATQQQDVSARLMHHTAGRLLVGVVGAIVVIVGLTMIYEGVKRKFEQYLDLSGTSPRTHQFVVRLGTVGTVGRGLVIGLAGVLAIDAAVRYQPSKARGLDGALHTLASQPYGRVLLVLAAIGLLAFGLYGLAEARWHRT
jgi:hypothetical protein